MSEPAWPTEVRLRAGGRELRLEFDSGEQFVFTAEFLRVNSPSAENKGHGGDMPPPQGKENVKILRLEPVGNYAIRLIFDDGHSTGLYSWEYFYKLGSPHSSSRTPPPSSPN